MSSLQEKQTYMIKKFFLKEKFTDEREQEAFVAECNGKKIVVLKEIFNVYKEFFNSYFENEASMNDVLNSDLFNNFLLSEEFYGVDKSFPHYTGIGKGYENSSKFFFYALKNAPAYELELYTSIALHIHMQAQLSNVDFFKNFKESIIFKVDRLFYAIIASKRYKIGEHINISQNNYLNKFVDEMI